MTKRIRIALAALLVAVALAVGAHSFSNAQVAGLRPPNHATMAGNGGVKPGSAKTWLVVGLVNNENITEWRR